MALSKTYNPAEIEDKWYAEWMENKLFSSQPDEREPYTIVIPPPNVTGVLHMGHMLNNTIQDVLIRKARMEGKNACWVPGTDHASIATEAKVVQHLRKQGVKKTDLGREGFLNEARAWKDKHGGIILDQLKKLGASCDWDRTSYTMDDHYYKAVIKVFIDFYNKGYIYRGLRMINWDCQAKTALSNEEVIYKEGGENSLLYSVKYKIANTDEYLVIATQRPETIMGDAAVAVNPEDERYKHLIGKKAIVPFVNREVPIIADTYVELDFGTGCLKVTPAHDPNDNEIGQRHNLEVIDTLNEDGTLNEKCGVPEWIGIDRFDARKKVVQRLRDEEILVDEKQFVTRIGRSERTNTVVEPRLSVQWFINMQDITGKALDAVENDEVKLYPAKFKNTYRHWMVNVRDWCISRQLWWGHRIPAWYTPDGEVVVAENEQEALKKAQEKQPNLTLKDLKQDEDVLDTWASSWLWPMQVFHGLDGLNPETGTLEGEHKELDYYYPGNVLVTAPEILFFWVARMIIAGYEYTGKKPFEDVYLTGIVRDKKGRKMSKSLGNSPDPIELMKEYSTDGVRTGMLFSSPAGNDLLFDVDLCKQGRNFANKIWNAYRLVEGWEEDETIGFDALPHLWIQDKIASALSGIESDFKQYRISDALMKTYKLIWDDFCSWYLEMIKPVNGMEVHPQTIQEVKSTFDYLLRILHPFMPFITEELWQNLTDRKGAFINNATWPSVAANAKADQHQQAIELVQLIRASRSKHGLSPKVPVAVTLHTQNPTAYQDFEPLLKKLAGVSAIAYSENGGGLKELCGTDEVWMQFEGFEPAAVDVDALQAELKRLQGFLTGIEKKLSNEKFVANAPDAVIDRERKKAADTQSKIEAITRELNSI